ncbi:MAG TPA: transglycosylase domain-containing protein [Thermoleophilaceae bacterium]|nr:transglycosylase domain-containing protein [Thermoleophilaceae bacterium]
MTHHQRKQRRRQTRGTHKARTTALVGLGVVLALVVIGIASVVGYVVSIAASTPSIDELKPINKGATSAVYAANGRLLGYVRSSIIRQPVVESDMPQDVRNATVAIEDSRFYKHHGVDFEGIVRAAMKNLENRKTLQGGSTITQQLVRSLYIKDPTRDFKRKVREAKLASELEDEHPKDWILTSYLNNVPYGTVNGETAVGIEAAAEIFFSKHAKDLTLDQAALLAGLPQAPSEYNPFKNPSAALGRRNEVLRAMVKNHYLTPSQAAVAMNKPLRLRAGSKYFRRSEPYFFDYVSELLIEKYGLNTYRRGGLRVYTTIDPTLQQAARQAIAGQLNQPNDPSSAVVSIDPRNGYIRAMASSGSYKHRNFNLAAQGHRQPGSTFKTFVLTTAVLKGVNPDAVSYVSKPLALNLPGGQIWKVRTYGGDYAGRISLTRATLRSDNTVFAQLDLDLGPKAVAKTAHMMGIRTKLDGLPAEGLGGLRIGVSPLEMADAYATLASGGVRHRPIAITKVKFPDGKSDDLGEVKGTRVMTDGQAYEVTKVLKMNVQSGTGVNANYGCPTAGKTGTTDNFTDAWFVGYEPHLTTSVWVGYPKASIQMRSVHGIAVAGATFPSGIWHDFMNVAHRGYCQDFPQPTTPFQASPFYGKYSKQGGPSDKSVPYYQQYLYNGSQQATPAPPGAAAPKKAKKYDPRLYEAPPQPAPQAAPPPSTPGNGNGNGTGQGNGNGNGTDGGGAAPPSATVQPQG